MIDKEMLYNTGFLNYLDFPVRGRNKSVSLLVFRLEKWKRRKRLAITNRLKDKCDGEIKALRLEIDRVSGICRVKPRGGSHKEHRMSERTVMLPEPVLEVCNKNPKVKLSKKQRVQLNKMNELYMREVFYQC